MSSLVFIPIPSDQSQFLHALQVDVTMFSVFSIFGCHLCFLFWFNFGVLISVFRYAVANMLCGCEYVHSYRILLRTDLVRISVITFLSSVVLFSDSLDKLKIDVV